MEAVNSAMPLPHFDYMSTMGCNSSHRHVPVVSHCHSNEVREVARPNRRPITGRKPRLIHWSERPTESSPEPGTIGEVNHSFNAVCNVFPTYWLVQGAGANLEPRRGVLGQRRTPERRSDRERTRIPPPRGIRVRLESSTSRSTVGSHGRTREPRDSTNDDVRWTRGPTLYLITQWPAGGRDESGQRHCS
ncbi:hypothetical protein Cgig2_027689 [Carnegiea gigantea]|uniref:Uncharacterized protein n=1 Tax=Carnegiea gigantea TaxID=171969 RepID=A0A9Q1GKM1_9CARY|nr:hypothetical protein Cgig2_027689 [Carnegiea gigantea]